uniref:Uncharacterized protein n=1 Tax=Rhizophora mucronata TaxID=61149 RepID=A0A2P2IV36_RHIMU
MCTTLYLCNICQYVLIYQLLSSFLANHWKTFAHFRFGLIFSLNFSILKCFTNITPSPLLSFPWDLPLSSLCYLH